MNRIIACLLGVAFILFLGIKSTHAQEVCGKHGLRNVQSSQSKTDSSQRGMQRRANCSAEENENNRIPKPQRNKLDESSGRKRNSPRKKKKNIKSKQGQNSKNNCKTVSGSDEESNSVLNKNRKSRKELSVTSERVDDIPLLVGVMVRMGMVKVLDNHIPSHWKQRELSWGWTAVIWLAYVLSEGDHRKSAVREYVKGMLNTLRDVTGQEICELDFTDDRLGILLNHLSKKEYWDKIEEELSVNTIEAYELEKGKVRCDATTVSGYHEISEGGLFQFGNSKDDPSLPQIKTMMGSLDPLGMPLATDVVSGEQADDKLYLAVIKRIHNILKKSGILYIGDCKMSSFENRLHIKGIEGHYLSPLPNTGDTAKQMSQWIKDGIEKDEKDELIKLIVTDDKGNENLKAKGYEIERDQSGMINGKEIKWEERLLITHSPVHAKQIQDGLERRILHATEKILLLTPQRCPGKKQITDGSELISGVEAILKRYKVEKFLSYEYEKQVDRKTKYVGRGKGGPKREQEVIENIRYQITKVARNEDKIKEEVKTYGWKVFVTDVSKDRLNFVEAVRCYRKEYRIERIFNRLKSRLNITPFFVKRDDQTKGITHFLTLGVRVLTLIEYIVRRSLKKSDEKLIGLHSENPNRGTDIPTSERILKRFSKITLTIIEMGSKIIRHLTPLSQLQIDILRNLELDSSIYGRLEIKQCSFLLSE